MTAKLTGACLCGSVRFEVSEPLVSAGYCHCTRCQRRTGTAASVQARVAPGSFRIVDGRNPHDPEQISVRLGAFDSDPAVRPSYRQFVAYAAAWEPIPDDGLERYPERRP